MCIRTKKSAIYQLTNLLFVDLLPLALYRHATLVCKSLLPFLIPKKIYFQRKLNLGERFADS